MDRTSPIWQSARPTLLLIALAALIESCGTTQVKSLWKSAESDGPAQTNAMSDSMATIDDARVLLGVRNDDKYLYIKLNTADQDLQRQITRQGITFWFDRKGGDDKSFGVHYPIALGGFRARIGERFGTSENAPDSISVPMQSSASELEVYGPSASEYHRMTIAETGGIEPRFHMVHDVLVYDIRVPISPSGYFPFTIGALPGQSIGIGIETTNARVADNGRGVTAGTGRGGRMGGRGQGGMGRGGGGRGGEMGRTQESRSQVKPLKTWVKTNLAVQDSNSGR